MHPPARSRFVGWISRLLGPGLGGADLGGVRLGGVGPAVLGLARVCIISCLLAGCGGGGAAPEPPVLLVLGTFSATTPSRVTRTFLNPLGAAATVTAATLEGPFEVDPNDLPGQVAAAGGVTLGLIFAPAGSGEATGRVVLRFSGGGQVRDRFFDVRAEGEQVGWTVTPSALDFGDVLPGNTRELELTLRNDSQRSTVTFTDAILPSPALALVEDPLPLTIHPGEAVALTVRYAPTSLGVDGGVLHLGPTDLGASVGIAVTAGSTGSGERIVDFGTQALSGGDTPELTVEVPSNAVSIAFEGTMTDAAKVGLRSLVGPGGKVYVTAGGTGTVRWYAGRKTFSVHLPSSDESATRLVSGGGSYKFRLQRTAGLGTSMDVRVIMELRAEGQNEAAVLPLNLFLAQGINPMKSTAANDANLQSMLVQLAQILASRGIVLGDVAYYDIASPSFDDVDQGQEGALFQLSAEAAELRLNLFLVRQVWSGELLGLAGTIDGAKRQGDSETGVVSRYIEGQAGAVAAVAAHEVCHYLGLWHTVEVDGTWDRINDTPNCPASGSDSVCSVAGGHQLMHWEGLGGTLLSSGQGVVLRGHPLLHAPGAGAQLRRKPKVGPWTPDARTLEFFRTHPGPWCGTQR